MKTSQLITRTLLVVTLFIAASIVAQAQSSVVYVTANRGSDLNTCSRTSPCRTIQHALATTVVQQGGTVMILDSGDYSSIFISASATPATVTSVTVEAAPGVSAVITEPDSSSYAVRVYAGAAGEVVLRGLTLKGMTTGSSGIYHDSGNLHIENCEIGNFVNDGIYFYGAGNLYVKDTTLRNLNRGIETLGISPNIVRATIDHCQMEGNASEGLYVGSNSRVIVRDSVASGSTAYGFSSGFGTGSANTAELNIVNCVSSHNNYGVYAAYGNIYVNASSITNNVTGFVGGSFGTIHTMGNNMVQNNTNPNSGTIVTNSLQ